MQSIDNYLKRDTAHSRTLVLKKKHTHSHKYRGLGVSKEASFHLLSTPNGKTGQQNR